MHAGAAMRIPRKELTNQLLCIRLECRFVVNAKEVLLVRLGSQFKGNYSVSGEVVCVFQNWRATRNTLIQNAAQGPGICRLCRYSTDNNLWWEVCSSALDSEILF